MLTWVCHVFQYERWINLFPHVEELEFYMYVCNYWEESYKPYISMDWCSWNMQIIIFSPARLLYMRFCKRIKLKIHLKLLLTIFLCQAHFLPTLHKSNVSVGVLLGMYARVCLLFNICNIFQDITERSWICVVIFMFVTHVEEAIVQRLLKLNYLMTFLLYCHKQGYFLNGLAKFIIIC